MIIYIILTFLLGVQLFFLNHLQFTAWPEMLSYPYLRNHGFLLYQDMIHPYPPVLTIGLSIVTQIFGYNLLVLKAMAWTISLSSSFLVYLVLIHITRNKLLSLLGLVFYVLTETFLEGNMLWFDTAFVPPILFGLYSVLRFLENKNIKWLIFAGLSLSFAALTKQTAALFLIALFIFLLFQKTHYKKLLIFSVTPLVLLIPLAVRLLQEGALEWFLQWTIIYPATFWGKYPNYVQMVINDRDMFILQILLIPPFVFALNKRSIFKESTFILLVLFLIVSLISIYPRFSFFHFQTALSLIVIFWIYTSSKINKNTTIVSTLCALLLFIPLVFKPTILLDWNKEARFMGKDDMALAKTIESYSKGNKVFLQGLNSNLYVISNTIPPKPWTDNFGWYLEIPGIQKQILERWEKDPPKLIFWRRHSPGNWFDLGTYEPKEFLEYYKLNYNFKGEISPGVELWSIRQTQDKLK